MFEDQMWQTANYPETLDYLVEKLEYKENWTFELESLLNRGQGSVGHTLVITIETPNSYSPHELRRVAHYFPVPPAAYDERSWRRWLFEQVLLVEKHEAMEFFEIDGHRPYAPSHGPGNDPYMVREVGTEVDVKTAFTGKVNE
jgi:hypothetical protein